MQINKNSLKNALKKIIKSLNDTRGKIAHKEFKDSQVIENYLILKNILNQIFKYEIGN